MCIRDRFHGRVVKAGCGADCWAAGVSDASVSVAAPGCAYADAVTTSTDGAYSIQVPYDVRQHGSTASLSFSKDGYSTYTKSVVLGATALSTSSGYYWASSSNSSIGDHCADGTTHAPVSALYCAAHGVALCAIYAAKYSASSTCQCWAGARIYGGGYGTCSGLPAATTGAELRVDAYAFESRRHTRTPDDLCIWIRIRPRLCELEVFVVWRDDDCDVHRELFYFLLQVVIERDRRVHK